MSNSGATTNRMESIAAGSAVGGALRGRLPASALRTECVPDVLGFVTTAELEPLGGLLGQERALRSIRFGTAIRQPGYNLFALGPSESGRHSAVLSFLEERARSEETPSDWVYVNNFDDARKPKALCLPQGRAVELRDGMRDLIRDLSLTIPAAFESEDYKARRRTIDDAFEEAQDKAFEDLQHKAESHNLGLLRTPMGIALAPIKDGKVIKPDDFNALPAAERQTIEAKMAELQEELKSVVERLPTLEKERRQRIREATSEFAKAAVEQAIGQLIRQFENVTAVEAYLTAVAHDLVDNVDIFLKVQGAREESPVVAPDLVPDRNPRLRRYLVNVLVSATERGEQRGAPVVQEDHPTLANLLGRIEYISQMGALVTDFGLIQPGALHKANGGYLVIDARSVLVQPFAWEALKRALKSATIGIESAAEHLGIATTISLEPDPIPLSVKVVLVGERLLYYLLCELDQDFQKLFKVQVDFEDEIVRSPEIAGLFARLVAGTVGRHGLKPFDANSVARLIDEGARMADDSERMSLRIGRIVDIAREADYWASEVHSDVVGRDHVERAIAEHIDRADRIRDKSHESITRDIVLVDTDGEKIGQVNGLSVVGIGDFRFGRPTRITARVRMGTGKVIDIEREVELGGPIHSKGVLILSSFLSARYALSEPTSLWASLVFEQSYGGVEGDSASSAELYALLSALAEVPLSQSIAVTGSVNQMGEVQAIGGVNDKIEGFFDICKARGLTGRQGVVIPVANVKHLMLRPEVVAAVKEDRFHVYSVATIDEGIEVLTGRPAGQPDGEGRFPAGSINALVEDTLLAYARARRRFGGPLGGPDDSRLLQDD
jgi:lon-related putative ATP-dependent protease